MRIDKPWGSEAIWAITPAYVAKILRINRGHRLSLQFHRRKTESVMLHSGRMVLVVEDDLGVLREVVLSPGETHHIPAGRRHRMIALEDCEVFEVSTPELDDIVRLEDSYGRVEQPIDDFARVTRPFSTTR